MTYYELIEDVKTYEYDERLDLILEQYDILSDYLLPDMSEGAFKRLILALSITFTLDQNDGLLEEELHLTSDMLDMDELEVMEMISDIIKHQSLIEIADDGIEIIKVKGDDFKDALITLGVALCTTNGRLTHTEELTISRYITANEDLNELPKRADYTDDEYIYDENDFEDEDEELEDDDKHLYN